MCKMLLSINPEHVKRIFDGDKKYEFRKVQCRNKVDSILIYETAPTMMVVGEAKIKKVLSGSPETIWHQTASKSGISKCFFDSYYNGKERAVAYELEGVKKFSNPISLLDFGIRQAPQSFVYI